MSCTVYCNIFGKTADGSNNINKPLRVSLSGILKRKKEEEEKEEEGVCLKRACFLGVCEAIYKTHSCRSCEQDFAENHPWLTTQRRFVQLN